MRMPVLFECPACGKKHYVAFCAGNDGGVECGNPFVSSFFPSGRDALCPRHQPSARPAGKGAAAPAPIEPPRNRCPSTQADLDIDAILRGPARGAAAASTATPRPQSSRTATPAPGARPGANAALGRVAPPRASRPPASAGAAPTPRPPTTARSAPVTLDDDTPASGTPAESADAGPVNVKCPACFVIYDRTRNDTCPRCGSAPDAVRKQRREMPTAALESAGEALTLLLLQRWKILAVLAGVVVLGLGALAATASAVWITALCLVGVLVTLIVGLGATMVYFRAIEIPFYRTQLAARARGETSGASLVAQLRGALGALRARSGDGAGKDPAAGAALREDRSTDLVAAALPNDGQEVTPSSDAVTVRAAYEGGHPGLNRAAGGRLVVDGRRFDFEGRRGGFRIAPGSVERVRTSWIGWIVALVLSVAVVAALVKLAPGPLHTYRTPPWVPWGPQLGTWLRWAHQISLGGAGVIATLLGLGLVLARHVVVTVTCRRDDSLDVVRFRLDPIAALRVKRALT